MGLLPAEFAKHLGVTPTQLNHYGKPVAIWVAVAVVVNQVWGKSYLIIYALGSVLVYVKLGPDFPLLKMLEGKTVIIVGMLLSNTYFKMFNPYLLGACAGFCMLIREWDLMSVVNRLNDLNAGLQKQNESLTKTKEDLSTQLSDVRDKFKRLLEQAKATQASLNAADAAKTQLQQQVQQTEDTLEKKLQDIESMVQLIVSDNVFTSRMAELQRVQQRAEELQTQTAKTLAKHETLLESFAQLESQLIGVLNQLKQFQDQYRGQVELIQNVLGQLKNLRPLTS